MVPSAPHCSFQQPGDGVMPDQTVDLGISREYLEKYLTHSGLWSTPERRQRNRYVLSPSAYAVSAAQRDNLETLGRATYKAVERLQETIAAHAAAGKKKNKKTPKHHHHTPAR